MGCITLVLILSSLPPQLIKRLPSTAHHITVLHLHALLVAVPWQWGHENVQHPPVPFSSS